MDYYFEVKIAPEDAASFVEFMKENRLHFVESTDHPWGHGSDDARMDSYYKNTKAVVYQTITKYIYGPMMDLFSIFCDKTGKNIQLYVYSCNSDMKSYLELYHSSEGHLVCDASFRMDS